MRLRIQNVSGFVLYGILLATCIIVAVFYFGGETSYSEQLLANPSMQEPAQTDTLLYWVYFLLGVTVAVSLASMLAHFLALFANAPRIALKSLMGVALLAVLMLIAWWAGSDVPLSIPGYETEEIPRFWFRVADMFLYTIYALLAVLVLLIVGNGIKRLRC